MRNGGGSSREIWAVEDEMGVVVAAVLMAALEEAAVVKAEGGIGGHTVDSFVVRSGDG